MAVNKTLAALEKVVGALANIDPEQRRQVIEAVHSLLPVGMGYMDGGCPGPDAPSQPAADRALRRGAAAPRRAARSRSRRR